MKCHGLYVTYWLSRKTGQVTLLMHIARNLCLEPFSATLLIAASDMDTNITGL